MPERGIAGVIIQACSVFLPKKQKTKTARDLEDLARFLLLNSYS